MKLDYDIKDRLEKKDISNRTKLSIQSTVSSALASKMPTAPTAQAPNTPAPTASAVNNTGWGASV